MKFKIYNYKLLIIIVLSMFLTGYPFRYSTFNGFFKYYNIFFIISELLLIYINRKNLNKKFIGLFIIIVFIFIISNQVNQLPFLRILNNFFITYFPLLLLSINWDNVKIEKTELKKVIKFYNVFVFIIFLIYIIDVFFGSIIMNFIANFIPYLSQWIPPRGTSSLHYRYASFLGQYLHTNFIYLSFFFINIYFNKLCSHKEKILPNWVIIMVSFVGVLSSGSKTGLAIMLISLLVLNVKKIGMLVTSILIFFGSYLLGLFDLVLNRIHSTSVSTGRFEVWESFLNLKNFNLNLFYGYGCGLVDQLRLINFEHAKVINELPLLFMPFEIGLIGTIIYYYLFYFNIIFNKNVNFTSRFILTMIFLCVNSFNGILVTPDTLILYTFAYICIAVTTKLYKNINKINNIKK